MKKVTILFFLLLPSCRQQSSVEIGKNTMFVVDGNRCYSAEMTGIKVKMKEVECDVLARIGR